MAKSRSRQQPHPYDVIADYEARSLAHAPGLPEQIEAPGLWRGVGYRLGGRRFASEFGEVVEIVTCPGLTPVPGAEAWLLGVGNIRGTLLPVIDLKQFLEGERTVMHANTRMLVIRQSGGNAGVLIDELFGQRNFHDAHQVEPGELAEGRYGHFVKRAYRLGEQEWGVFSMSMLTRTPEFRQAAA